MEQTKQIVVILFYKFHEIEDPDYFARKQRAYCKKLGVVGKVLVAKEGINSSISGTRKQIEEYKKFIWSLKGFYDVRFKEELAYEHPFTKLQVKVKKEIIRLDKKIDLKNRGEYIKPRNFLALYENNEDFIILDARNNYEYKIGRFKKAINPKIKSFREFPRFVEKFEKEVDKNQKIITYCTGGIRCEKASAYLKEKGFENVYQLEGGIINFCQQFPNTIWEGKCFVFDKRLISDINQNNKPITYCEICGVISDLYRNCKNIYCDRLTIICIKCQEKLHGCCSIKCK